MRNTNGLIVCKTIVPGRLHLLLTGHVNGTVNLWDIDAGTYCVSYLHGAAHCCAGVHVWCVIRTDAPVRHITATTTRLACVYGEKTLVIVPLNIFL
jgi:hypothetical protein